MLEGSDVVGLAGHVAFNGWLGGKRCQPLLLSSCRLKFVHGQGTAQDGVQASGRAARIFWPLCSDVDGAMRTRLRSHDSPPLNILDDEGRRTVIT